MDELAMCRVCLAEDVRLLLIANTHLQEMYESLTLLPLETKDSRPIRVCYICCAELQNSYQLRTKCLRSEELFTQILSSDGLQPLNVQKGCTQRLRVEHPVIHLSIDDVLQNSTDDDTTEDSAHRSEATDVVDHDPEKQQDSEVLTDIKMEPQEEHDAQIDDNIQSSHLYNPLDVMKREPDDVETDAEHIKIEEDITIEVNEPNGAYQSSFSVYDNICPKIEKVVLERMELNDTIPATGCFLRSEDLKRRRQATEKISIEATLRKIKRNKEAEAEFGELGRIGARVSKKPKFAALKDTEDATANKRKIEENKNEPTETVTIEEPKIVTKKIEVEKSITASKTLETCDKCNDNVLTSMVNDDCKQKFTNDTFLEQNVSSISSRKNKSFSCDEKPYQCNVCKMRFSYKNVLETHIRTHTGDKPYQCNVCKKCFWQKGHFKTHILTHTGEKPYQCNVCKTCFSYKNVLKIHIRTHTGEKPYQCNVCKKSFIQKGHLKTHILTHTGENPYQCNVCKKSFSDKNNLKTHIRTHTGEKPYECNVCKKCFTQKGHLKTHILTHTGEKPYQCNVCKKCFSYKDVLKHHIRTHTGEKPYQCNVCNKCFILKGDMNKHIRTHTGEKPYQCNVCKKCFSDSSTCSRHIRIHKR